jgi:hypothetical protein
MIFTISLSHFSLYFNNQHFIFPSCSSYWKRKKKSISSSSFRIHFFMKIKKKIEIESMNIKHWSRSLFMYLIICSHVYTPRICTARNGRFIFHDNSKRDIIVVDSFLLLLYNNWVVRKIFNFLTNFSSLFCLNDSSFHFIHFAFKISEYILALTIKSLSFDLPQQNEMRKK